MEVIDFKLEDGSKFSKRKALSHSTMQIWYGSESMRISLASFGLGNYKLKLSYMNNSELRPIFEKISKFQFDDLQIRSDGDIEIRFNEYNIKSEKS